MNSQDQQRNEASEQQDPRLTIDHQRRVYVAQHTPGARVPAAPAEDTTDGGEAA